MAKAAPFLRFFVAKARAFGSWLGASLKSQWIAASLILPLCFFVAQTHIAREDAKEARRASGNIERITKVRESGKDLDLALASYYDAVAEYGLAERHIQGPGTFRHVTLAKARSDVVDARLAVQKAMGAHASDLESLRGVFDPVATSRYVAALAQVNSVVEDDPELKDTNRNIVVLGNLVKERNSLVDSAMAKVS